MKVICISGHAQHGKDTVAQIMRKTLWGYGKRVLIIHYADLLKFMCKQLFGWNGEKDEKGRTLLQYVGTDIVRSKNHDFWVNYIIDILSLFDGEWDYVLIPDCRFPNEVNTMKQKGFDVTHLRVIRHGFDNGLTDDQLSHASETAINELAPDSIINNDGNLVDLTISVLNFIRPIFAAEETKRDGNEHFYDIA